MTTLLTPAFLLILPACLAGGLVLGLIYFRAVRASADLIVSAGSPRLGLALTLGRVVVMAFGLVLAVQAGGAALLATLGGVLCARAVLLGRDRSTPA